MDDNELISKKELLQLTKISYGQLYRWKRENLIPESWFIKKSSYTGQETFFPKDKILNRVNEILKLKDQYSLEELANMISPGLTKSVFDGDALKNIKDFSPEIIEIFKNIYHKQYYLFFELLFIYVLSKYKRLLTEEDIIDAAKSVEKWAKALKDSSYRFIILIKEPKKLFLLAGQDSKLLFDWNTREILAIDLEETAKELGIILNNIK